MSFQAIHPHEMGAFWHFADRDQGLSPYWALSKMSHQKFDGYADLEFTHEGTDYKLKFTYNPDTGIVPRPEDPISADRLYEYKIHVESIQGQVDADYKFSPRFTGMMHPDGHDLENNLGWPYEREGVDVHVQGSNLWPWEYKTLLRQALDTLADEAGQLIRRDYFQNILPSSSIYELEGYVRITREMSMKLIRNDGVFYRIMHLLADQRGTSWVYSADNTEIVGKRHEMKLGAGAARELLSTLSSGVVLKCYHPKYARSEENSDDPLSSPAFRAKFHKQQNNGKAFDWGESQSMLRDLQEVVTNVLTWANIPAQPDGTTFVEDDHFSVGPSEFDVERFSDPTPGLEAEQDHLLLSVLDDLCPSGRAVAKQLATDGGVHVQEVAEDTGYSIRQVYRALEQLDDVVQNDNGELSFVSEKLR